MASLHIGKIQVKLRNPNQKMMNMRKYLKNVPQAYLSGVTKLSIQIEETSSAMKTKSMLLATG